MSNFKLPGEFKYDGMVFGSQITSPKMIEGVKNVQLNPRDTVIASTPKSGTTWMKFLVHLVANGGIELEASIHFTIPCIEFRYPGLSEEELLKQLTEMPSPRLLSTHLPFRTVEKQVLEDKAKFIVVMRNPKDNLVSFYHYYQMHKAYSFSGTWDDFFQLFTDKKLKGEDFFDYYLGWWAVKDLDNVLIVKYEDMKKSLDTVVRKVAKFMNRDLSEEVIAKIVHLASFEQMKDNPNVNGIRGVELGVYDFRKSKFMRKGVIGDWTNFFSAEQAKYVDRLYEERCKPVGLVFVDLEDSLK